MIEVHDFLHQKQGEFVSLFASVITPYQISQKSVGVAEVRPNAALGCWDLVIIQIESRGMDLWPQMENMDKTGCIPSKLGSFYFSGI
jgi:hypothetical protein